MTPYENMSVTGPSSSVIVYVGLTLSNEILNFDGRAYVLQNQKISDRAILTQY